MVCGAWCFKISSAPRMMYKGKALVIIKQNGNQAYVWKGLVKIQ